jgi:hypothetical protein
VLGKASARERNERFSDRRSVQGVGKRKKRAIQRAAQQARRLQDTETSDSASGAAGNSSARIRNEWFSEGRSGQNFDECKKRAMQQASPRQENEMSDAASGAAGK